MLILVVEGGEVRKSLEMALLRRLFFRKPPDGLLEISERVYGSFRFTRYVYYLIDFYLFIFFLNQIYEAVCVLLVSRVWRNEKLEFMGRI